MVQANVGPVLCRALDVLDGWLDSSRRRGVGGRGAAGGAPPGARRARVIVPNAQALLMDDRNGSARALIREGLGMPDDALLVVYVGYLTPDRLLALLLDAVCALPDVWLLIGGVGPQADLVARTRRAARAFRRWDGCQWTMCDIVSSADVCIMASTRRTLTASTSCRSGVTAGDWPPAADHAGRGDRRGGASGALWRGDALDQHDARSGARIAADGVFRAGLAEQARRLGGRTTGVPPRRSFLTPNCMIHCQEVFLTAKLGKFRFVNLVSVIRLSSVYGPFIH